MCGGKNKLCLYVGPVLCACRQNLLRILKGYIYIYTFYYWDLSLRVILFGRSTQKGMGWAGNVACMGEKRNVYVVVVGKAEGKRPLGRSRNTWKDNVKCFKEIE